MRDRDLKMTHRQKCRERHRVLRLDRRLARRLCRAAAWYYRAQKGV